MTDSHKHSSLLRLGVRKFNDTGSWNFCDRCIFDIIVKKTYHGHSMEKVIDFMLCSVRFHSRFDQILNSFLTISETCLF